ncbi:MAG: ATP-binding protein, partial [Solirubrobacteraceae bacterium]
RWNYERAVFVASAPAGRTVAKWLARERIALPSPSIKLQLDGSVGVDRRYSRFQGIYQQLPWPTQEWTVYVRDSSGQMLHDELVAAGAPALITFDQAAAAFFGVPLKPNRNFSGREIVVRQQDRRARIDNVLVCPTELLVEESGEQLRGTSLTLSGVAGATRSLSARTRQIRLPIPVGLGAGAWLALHRDRELLDRRILDPARGGKDFRCRGRRLHARRAADQQRGAGNGRVQARTPRSGPAKVMKTVAAFANGGGGAILFGVEDDGEIVGVGEQYTRRTLDRLTSMISDWVRPLPGFECTMVDVRGHGVIAINVASGSAAPSCRRRNAQWQR